MTLEITHQSIEVKRVSLYDMPVGSIGMDDEGYYFYRTSTQATCLNDPGHSYANPPRKPDVTLLPSGTTLKMIVRSGSHSTVDSEVEED